MTPERPQAGPLLFRRVLLKLSGESFCRPGEGGINAEEVRRIAEQAARVARQGVELAIVVGGGNILRGATLAKGTDVIKEATGHYMGMMATVINGLALQDALEGVGCQTRLMTTIRMEEVAEPYIRRRALNHLANGRVVILAAAPAAPSSPPTRRPPCAARSSRPRSCSRRPASTASTRPTPRRTPTPSATRP